MTSPAPTAAPVLMPLSTNGVQVWPGSGQQMPVLIANLDTTRTAYVGYTQPLALGAINAIPLAPNQAFAFDGSRSIYAAQAAGGAGVLVIPGATQYFSGNVNVTGGTVTISGGSVTISGTPNINIAGQTASLDVSAATVNISPQAGSIFPIGSIAQLISIGSQTIAANGNSYMTPVQDVRAYTSFALELTAHCGAQANVGAPLTSQILMQWWADAGATILLYNERWYGWLGNAIGVATPVMFSGPMFGPYMTVTVFNPTGTTQTITIDSGHLWGTGRTLTAITARQIPPTAMFAGVNQFLAGGTFGDDNILWEGPVNIVANGTNWQPLPLHAGNVQVRFAMGSVALANNFVVCDGSSQNNGNLVPGTGCPGIIWDTSGAASSPSVIVNLVAPRGPLFWIAHATATPPSFTLSVEGA